ncbi:hypothetical protein [Streptomyces sp. NPDC001404]|uniref:DUF6197 family protein n=1 Tax=Streptomyces sp. NPDC001404 TaxID=3364571 RepID=UPI00367A3BF2
MPEHATVDTDPLLEDAGRLVAEIEQYLAAQPRRPRGTAHPLVTKSTAELVAEALAQPSRAEETPGQPARLACPPALLRFLPDWVLPVFRGSQGARRAVSVAEFLELAALVIERVGWAQGRGRTRSGRRCIGGALVALFQLGYGTEATARAAGDQLEAVLAGRGLSMPFWRWNDSPDRTVGEVLYLLREAAAAAGATHH